LFLYIKQKSSIERKINNRQICNYDYSATDDVIIGGFRNRWSWRHQFTVNPGSAQRYNTKNTNVGGHSR